MVVGNITVAKTLTREYPSPTRVKSIKDQLAKLLWESLLVCGCFKLYTRAHQMQRKWTAKRPDKPRSKVERDSTSPHFIECPSPVSFGFGPSCRETNISRTLLRTQGETQIGNSQPVTGVRGNLIRPFGLDLQKHGFILFRDYFPRG